MIIGTLHLKPLPGEYLNEESFEEILEFSIKEARKLEEGGVDAILIENFNDKPFGKYAEKHTIAFMSVIAHEIRKNVSLPIGINVLRNDPLAAIAIAEASRAKFIRVNVLSYAYISPEGLLEGQARKVLLYKKRLKSNVKLFADIFVKHAKIISYDTKDYEEIVLDTIERCLADAIILTGRRTGEEVDINLLKEVKRISTVPVIVGSGINERNIDKYLEIADAVIVGSYFKKGDEICIERVRKLTKKRKKSCIFL